MVRAAEQEAYILILEAAQPEALVTAGLPVPEVTQAPAEVPLTTVTVLPEVELTIRLIPRCRSKEGEREF